MIFLNFGDFLECWWFWWFSWILVIFLNFGDFHEFGWFSWIWVIFLNLGDFLEFWWFSCIWGIYLNLGDFLEITLIYLCQLLLTLYGFLQTLTLYWLFFDGLVNLVQQSQSNRKNNLTCFFFSFWPFLRSQKNCLVLGTLAALPLFFFLKKCMASWT